MKYYFYLFLAHCGLMAALLIGTAGTALAGTPCGTNLEYEIDGTILRFRSPDPTSDASIQTGAFKNNITITAVTLPENVWQIGAEAFSGCTSLANVDLGSVRTISTKAFEGCTTLQEIILPPTVSFIDVDAFSGCSNLHWVYCRPQTPPTLGASGNVFKDCADDLVLCVSKLNYRSTSGWNFYYDNIQFCYLDENDEQDVTTAKISAFSSGTPRSNIDIFRTLRKAGCFNTLTLPFNVPDIDASPLAGAEVCEFVGATVRDGELQLDITPLSGKALTAGTPYLIQWPNTGEVLNRMTFTGITWDADQTADHAGSGEVLLHGFYGKTHISDVTNGETHLNLFLQGGNELYWPTDGDDETAKMLGFRAWFQITGTSVGGAPVRRNMPAALHIVSTPTGLESVQPSDTGCRKQLINGQLIIIRNGEKYSINGQRL
jgi:hypothetical protein